MDAVTQIAITQIIVYLHEYQNFTFYTAIYFINKQII